MIDTGSTGLKPDWFVVISLLSRKKSKDFVKNKSVEGFATYREQGNWMAFLLPFLWIGTMLAFFQSGGKEPEINACFKHL